MQSPKEQWSDLPQKEKAKIIKKSIKEANEAQKELIKKHDKTWEDLKNK